MFGKKRKAMPKLNMYQLLMMGCVIFVAAVFLMLYLGQRVRFNDFGENEYNYEIYENGWKQVLPDGYVEVEKLPAKLETTDGKITIINNLPKQIDEGTWMSVTGYISIVKIYIDDNPRVIYSLRPGEKGIGSRTSPSAYVFARLYKNDAGKEVRIEVESDSMFKGWVGNVLIGSQGGIWGHYACDTMGSTLITMVLGAISIITIIIASYFVFVTKKASAVLYLAIGILCLCFWRLGSTPSSNTFMQYETSNLNILFEAACQILAFTSVPFLLFADCLQAGRYKTIYKLIEDLCIIYGLVVSYLHYAGIIFFAGTLIYTFIVIFLSLSFVLVFSIIDFVSGRIKEYRAVSIGLIIFMIMMVFELVREFSDIRAISSLIYVFGMMILLISVVVEAVLSMIRAHSSKLVAVAAGEKKNEFLSLMSHRVRTPVNTISGMAELIEREAGDQDIKAYAGSIKNAVRMLMSLINDMLDMEKSDNEKIDLEYKEYSLAPLLVDCITLLISRARQDGLEFVTDVSGKLPSTLYGDPVRVMQIITNVLTNAVKYTNRGTITFIADEEYIDGVFNLCVTVKDTGIGIKQEDIGAIFNSYNRVDERENRHIEGTGLGLSITKKLVDAMKGKITVESVYGKGSTFKIVIPQKVISNEPIGDLDEAIRKYTLQNVTYKELFHAPEAKVLVVDDNKMNISVFVGLLKNTQIQIDTAGGGDEAYEKARLNKYDLIFMDHMMPEPDGIQTLHLLKNNYMAMSYATPVVALTANATPGAENMYLKEGFVAYLSKPVDPKTLEKMLLDLLPKEKIQK